MPEDGEDFGSGGRAVRALETFWAGSFGDEYSDRNVGERLLASNLGLFAGILRRTGGVQSILEFGAGSGQNARAIRGFLPTVEYSAVEINAKACKELRKIPELRVHEGSILDFSPVEPRELVFTKGVLIHMDPADLEKVYELLYYASRKWICLVEYHSPRPVEIVYRGEKGKLWKRDFCGEMMERYRPFLKLVDYGFLYRGDEDFGQGEDLHWFLMEKV